MRRTINWFAGIRWIARGALWAAGVRTVAGLFDELVRKHPPFRFDDTFITLRYAWMLRTHGRLSFNWDDRVDGYTSAGWTALLALLGPSEALACWLSRAAGLGAVLAAALWARLLGATTPMAFAIAAAGTLLTHGFVSWSLPGMETSASALCATLLLAAFSVPEPAHRRAAWGLAVARAAMLCTAVTMRPDALVLAGVLLAFEVGAQLWARLRGDAALAARRRPYTVALLGAATLLGALALWRTAYYGHPFPNTFYFKRGSDLLRAHGERGLQQFLASTGVWVGFASALVLAARRSLRGPARAACVAYAVWFIACARTYSGAGGDYMPGSRFYLPLVPGAFALLAGMLGDALRGGARRAALVDAWGLAIALFAARLWPAIYEHRADERRGDEAEYRRSADSVTDWESVGRALAARFAPATHIAVRAAGVIPYVTRFHTYDQLGLNNMEVAHGPLVSDYPGHQREATAAQIVAARPEVILGHPHITRSPDALAPFHANNAAYEAAGYRWAPVRVSPNAYVGLWVREGTPAAAAAARDPR